jgi:hypothetical protein
LSNLYVLYMVSRVENLNNSWVKQVVAKKIKGNINSFIFTRNKCCFRFSEGFSALEKMLLYCPQRAFLPVLLGSERIGPLSSTPNMRETLFRYFICLTGAGHFPSSQVQHPTLQIKMAVWRIFCSILNLLGRVW